ncbi:hypothetical protein [Paraburkholderia susongensis]|uniref:Uncharacterized protein n=1 Tax=Paraburkholderia susongensis TaxID=1515439 RepID=A0A1X7M3E1_9BURK|nr:hypothetical protein [Paraburkholderia susongensis]SMG59909.1 hypothetical protein SAMN06265784_114124 [Paraburkholderia susongensis]
MSEQLWCVHIEGLNDFIAVDSREAAQQEARAINAYIERAEQEREQEQKRRAALPRAVAVEWPFAAAGHARALDGDWHDLQRMAHRWEPASERGGVLSNIARRVKELVTVGRDEHDEA